MLVLKASFVTDGSIVIGAASDIVKSYFIIMSDNEPYLGAILGNVSVLEVSDYRNNSCGTTQNIQT